MIDEKKLIEDIENSQMCIKGLRGGKLFLNSIIKTFYSHVMEIIDNQPKVNEWVPVEKELPKEDGQYLVYYSCEIDGSVGEDKECGYSVEYFDTDAQSFGYYQKIFDPVTLGFIEEEFVKMETAIAWMPLPEPCGGNENEQN